MARYQVILAYDGTHYRGFQRQAKARTVQGVVEAALREFGWSGRAIQAAGRTDTGVHASGQVIAFDLDWKHPPEELGAALNARLPEDVAVQSVMQVEADFHPRYDAVARTYRYRIYCQANRDPLMDRYAWQVWPAVGMDLLEQAASLLSGGQDFAAFGTPPRSGGSTHRTVFQAQWSRDDQELIFEITADAFLYRMVRRLVSFQVELGQGRRELAALMQVLALPPDSVLQGLAPAHGLTLVKVTYPSDGARITI